MVTEDYVSFGVAKLLKEKGFDWNTLMSYDKNGEVKDILRPFFPSEDIAMPTLQMAMKWLREVHNQIIVPGIRVEDTIPGKINCYIVGIWYVPENNGGAFCYTSPTPYNGYPSFEEACEAGIRYCLENLI